jgi:starch phosphorylase
MDRHSSTLTQYECGPLKYRGSDSYNRDLVFDHVGGLENASPGQQFEAVGLALRDLLTQRWLTQHAHDRANAKRVYYPPMEFLSGRTLVNNVLNLGVEEHVCAELRSDPRQQWTQVLEQEPDAGLGNGGLGRLAACFIDSLATLQIPAMGQAATRTGAVLLSEESPRPAPASTRPRVPALGPLQPKSTMCRGGAAAERDLTLNRRNPSKTATSGRYARQPAQSMESPP